VTGDTDEESAGDNREKVQVSPSNENTAACCIVACLWTHLLYLDQVSVQESQLSNAGNASSNNDACERSV